MPDVSAPPTRGSGSADAVYPLAIDHPTGGCIFVAVAALCALIWAAGTAAPRRLPP